ncbi:MAG TPA: alpha/beta hydrolase [Acidimicrobiales bacterium]|nr:alpha/beta hydrolase [Acidimicrobiales bacterium]
MAWITAGGTDVHVVEAGAGQPLLFLHGFGSCAAAWHRQFEAFSGRCRVVAYDSVNHGHSSVSPEGEPEPDRADELEAVLDALGIDRPILAGNSMGALTILRWATRHPDRAVGLIPSGMGVAPPSEGDDAEGPAAARRARMFAPIDEATLFIPAEGGFTPEFPATHPLEYDRYIRLRSTATRIEASRHPRRPTAVDPARDELADRVPHITSPMQIVVGERDWLRDHARHLHTLVPGSLFAEIPGAPHNVYYETAEAYNAVVSAFLDALGI